MDKRERRLRKAVAELGCTVELGSRRNPHYIVTYTKTGRSVRASLTPKNVDHWIKNVCKDIRRYLHEST